jgi:ubiquinone/menaquinone biosynthesis C-methylase UbiE
MSKNRLYKQVKKQMKLQGIEIPKELISLRKAYNSTEIKQIVTYNDFKQYIMDEIIGKYKTKRGNIIGLNALQLRSKRFINYVDMNSNKQFTTLYKLNNTQLIAMLNHFVGQMDSEIINIMIKYEKTDEYILEYIKKNFNFQQELDAREFRNSKIAHFVNSYFLQSKNNLKFLDLGVGNGNKIKSITSYFKNSYDLYGADIEEWGSYKKDRKLDFTFKVIQMKPYKIPYNDKMFDCIFIILTTHHCENIIEVLTECKRILKDDGCICTVEHDVWSDDVHLLVDLQHRIYANIFNEPKDSPKATYYNYIEWNIIFNKAGYKYIHGDRLQSDIDFHLRYDMPNIIVYCKKEYDFNLNINR